VLCLSTSRCAVVNEPVNAGKIRPFDPEIQGVEPSRAIEAACEKVDDRNDRTADLLAHTPVEQEQGRVIKLILKHDVSLESSQTMTQRGRKVVTEASQIVSPRHRDDRDAIPGFAQSGNQSAVI
jgi:hypothetical protein